MIASETGTAGTSVQQIVAVTGVVPEATMMTLSASWVVLTS